jgi:LAO/AO transport system kinase
MQPGPDILIEGIRNRNQQSIARAISVIADRRPGWEHLLKTVWDAPCTSTFIGITGAPGSGKSTLADALIRLYRAAGRRVGVIAVDPSSPFSGGAILGDRLRMQDHAEDPDVFIRSMASRGRLGGLAPATAEAAGVLAMAGYNPILIETVGVGQSEVDVMTIADVVLMVLVPGNGDSIQALKAGVMEIGDIFVLNQADRPGADRLMAEVQTALRLSDDQTHAERVHQTVATEGTGVADVLAGIESFMAELNRSPEQIVARQARQFSRLVNLAVHDMTDAGLAAYRSERPDWKGTGKSWADAVAIAQDFMKWLSSRQN